MGKRERLSNNMAIKLPDTSALVPQYSWVNNRRSITSLIALSLLLCTWYLIPNDNTGAPKHLTPPFLDFRHGPLPPIAFPTSENYPEFLKPISLENATAVFNTVNSALRPKHSQLLPNGVSFIPAYIPEGSLLYHGNSNGEIPNGLEWIAMDHEFSFSFISHRGGPGRNGSFPGPPGGHHGGPPPHPGDGKEPEKGRRPPPPSSGGPGGIGVGGPDHGKHNDSRNRNNNNKDHSSMLTFQATRPLDRMILLDGSSAAKSSTGEMDTQMILARVGANDSIGEYEAAQRICQWGKKFGIDGFIRIEVGFEAVICNFHSDKLKLISNVTLDWSQESLGFPLESDKIDDKANSVLESIGAVAGYDQIKQGNVHDKRDGRILLDYRGLTTPLNKTWISLDPYLRRINNISESLKEELIQDLDAFMTRDVNPYVGTDWQLVTDEIVDKFAPILKKLNDSLEDISKDSTDEDILQASANLTIYTSNFVRRFTDHAVQDENVKIALAKKQAVYQYSHPLQPLQSDSDVLIWSSIAKITEKVVDIIFEISKHSQKILVAGYVDKIPVDKYKNSLIAAQENLAKVLAVLNWSIYYECDQVCGWDEVCYTPSWGPNPLGFWGGGGFGTVVKEGETRARITSPLQCVSYRTILENRYKD